MHERRTLEQLALAARAVCAGRLAGAVEQLEREMRDVASMGLVDAAEAHETHHAALAHRQFVDWGCCALRER